jgi:tRNA G37 N-methylase Trm5
VSFRNVVRLATMGYADLLVWLCDLIRHVLANDLSPSAAEAMRRNVDYNDVGPSSARPTNLKDSEAWEGRVRVTEGDAW